MSIIKQLRSKVIRVNPFNRVSTNGWKPYSRLMISGDGSDWSLDWDCRELEKISKQLGIWIVRPNYITITKDQSVFYTSRYNLLMSWVQPQHRIGFPYYHGKPSSGKDFARMISTIKTHHEKIARIQVSHSEMHDVILETGIDPHKVFRIPIGINLGYFDWTTQKIRAKTRKILDIPQSSVVIGSFQKDGIGWGKGLEPKLIKGPDIFMSAIKTLKDQVPELYILLTGPARGYVKEGLKKLGIPYTHKVLKNYSDIGLYYNALDLYIVSSREEGGPKAVLESMASGIPLVTTRVGQAMDLVKHGENGWMVEPEDVEGLAYWIKYVIENHDSIHEVLKKGLEIANRNSYLAQTSLWKNFMEGFVSFN